MARRSFNSHADHAVLTPDQRLRVFISSTLRELAQEREAAKKAVSRLKLTPILFESGARPHPAQELYRSYLAQSDIFIGIYWQQYGWVAPDMEVSGLEDEYALSTGMPRLVYIKNPAPDREEGLKALLARIKNEDTVSYKYFSTPAELKRLIENDLVLLLSEGFSYFHEEPGGVTVAQPERPAFTAALPRKLSRFIGRKPLVDGLVHLLSQEGERLVTLTGPGGVGKTRLSLEAADRLAPQFADGVFFVDLAPVTEPDQVIIKIAGTLGVRQIPGRPLLDCLSESLRDKDMLFLLDNMEQVVAAGPLIAQMIAPAPRVRALITSREVLQVQGEREVPVPPMLQPGVENYRPDAIREVEAVQLFLERAAGRVDPSPENLIHIAKICRRLDGLPLAIELAAARTRLFSPAHLLARLEKCLKDLGSGEKDLPDRQKTLENTIDWSYQLLEPAEQVVFSRLAVFQGGWGFEAAEAVSNMEGAFDILEITGSLLNKSLIFRQADLAGEPRFNMLETIRAYAGERLEERGEKTILSERHARYFHRFNDRDKTMIITESTHEWLAQLDANLENFRAAFERCQAEGWFMVGARMALDLLNYFYIRGFLTEGLSWYQRMREKVTDKTSLESAYLLSGAGMFTCWIGDLPEARRLLDEAIALLRRYDDTLVLGEALMFRGISDINAGSGEAARPFLNEALGCFRSARQPYFMSIVLMHLANVELDGLHLDEARSYLQQSEQHARETRGIWVLASVLNNLGEIARCQKDYTEAERCYRESGAIFRKMNVMGDYSRYLHSLAYVVLHQGDPQQAITLFLESLVEFRELGIQRGIAECLAGIAACCAAQNRPETGTMLLRCAENFLQKLDLDWWPADRLEVIQTRQRLFPAYGGSDGQPQGDQTLSSLALDEAVEMAFQLASMPSEG